MLGNVFFTFAKCWTYARTSFLRGDERKMDWPQYVVVGEIIRIASKPEGPLDWRKAFVRFSGCWFFWEYSQYIPRATCPEKRHQSQRSFKPSGLMISQLFWALGYFGFWIRNHSRCGWNSPEFKAILPTNIVSTLGPVECSPSVIQF